MERARRHVRRVLVVALIVVVVWLLLQANRLLPGTWPGGGDKGLEPDAVGTHGDASHVKESGAKPPPAEPPPGHVRVIVRTNEGELRGEGTFAIPDVARGLVVKESTSTWRHGMPRVPSRTWVVAVSTTETAPARIEVAPTPTDEARVEVTSEGKPVAGASVTFQFPGGEMEAPTGADGIAKARLASPVFFARVDGPDRATASAYGAVERTLSLDLSPLRDVATRFVDPEKRAPIAASTVALVSADGTRRVIDRGPEGVPDFRASIPAPLAATQALEIEVAGRPMVRVPVASLSSETPIPAGRQVHVRVVGADGAPLAGAHLEAQYGSAAEPGGGAFAGSLRSRAETTAGGDAMLAVPNEGAVELTVSDDAHAPSGVHFDPAKTGSGVVEVRLENGVRAAVEVVDGGGKPLDGAYVLVETRAGSAPARRGVRTGTDGRATLPPAPAGHATLYAHRDGFAWSMTLATLAKDSAPIRVALEPGFPLRMVVEDPLGVPIDGASVRSQGSGPEGAPSLGAPGALPWRTNRDGLLQVDDLPASALDLFVSHAGYAATTVRAYKPGTGALLVTLAPEPR